MIFDIIFLVLLFVLAYTGYRKGLVSLILALGLYGVAFFSILYINNNFIFFDNVFGTWIQTIILAIISGIIIQFIIKIINFENWLVLGFASRLLGALLYAIVFAALASIIIILANIFVPEVLTTYTSGSQIIKMILSMIARFL